MFCKIKYKNILSSRWSFEISSFAVSLRQDPQSWQKIKVTEATARVHQASLLHVFYASKTRPAIQS